MGLDAFAQTLHSRWPLWIPVLFGLGIGLYFSLDFEPPLWVGVGAFSVALVGAVGKRHDGRFFVLALAFLWLSCGFSAAQLRAVMVAAPMLEKPVWAAGVSGLVVSVEPRGKSLRVVLDQTQIKLRSGQLVDGAPDQVRLRLKAGDQVTAGQRIAVKATLMPPPPPASPGAFDFSRAAWFQGIGGVGWATGAVEILDGGDAEQGVASRLARLRQAMTHRILNALPAAQGAVAAALVTGEKGAIPDDILNAYRDSGLAHLLAISGLHMGLVAGLVFFLVRGGLALVPPVALRFPIKKWTAWIAMCVTFFYMLIAGAPVPTQRAFLMTAIVLIAILADRNPVSMRLVAWAAVVVLAIRPEVLMGPSFQMSFSAVIALVAVYEGLGAKVAAWRSTHDGWSDRLGLYLGGVILTTLVAGTATSIFGIYHFNRFATFSMIANAAAVPITGFWVMPWALVGLILMPLGGEHLGLVPMGWGIAAVNWVAAEVASWPGAALPVRAMPVAALVAFTFGGLWLCLWTGLWRWAGLAGFALGLGLHLADMPPDLLIHEDGRLVAIRGADGMLAFSSPKAGGLDRETWIRRNGEEGKGQSFPAGPAPDGALACDRAGCILIKDGRKLALAYGVEAVAEDCAVVDAMISLVPARKMCRNTTIVADRFDLWREGSHAVWFENGTTRSLSVAQWQGRRPWSRHRGQADEDAGDDTSDDDGD